MSWIERVRDATYWRGRSQACLPWSDCGVAGPSQVSLTDRGGDNTWRSLCQISSAHGACQHSREAHADKGLHRNAGHRSRFLAREWGNTEACGCGLGRSPRQFKFLCFQDSEAKNPAGPGRAGWRARPSVYKEVSRSSVEGSRRKPNHWCSSLQLTLSVTPLAPAGLR